MLRGSLVASAAALALAGCAQEPIAPGKPKLGYLEIAPYTSHEDCADLIDGDRLDYRFESTYPLLFTIYYLDGGANVAPITRGGTTSEAGVFVPRIAARYCLSWEAGAAGARLSYRANVRRSP